MSKMDHIVPAGIVPTHATGAFGSGLAANRNEQKVNIAEMTT